LSTTIFCRSAQHEPASHPCFWLQMLCIMLQSAWVQFIPLMMMVEEDGNEADLVQSDFCLSMLDKIMMDVEMHKAL